MKQKNEVIAMAVKSGLRDMGEIKDFYDKHAYAKGGYKDWVKQAESYKGLNIRQDPTYDYYGYYQENPQRAWDMLNDVPGAHFVDRYKTAMHPSFSNQSKYSGYPNFYNPKGIIGGTWLDTGDPNLEKYEFSDSQIDNGWDINNTLNEFEWARANENVKPYATYKGGMMLPNFDVIGKKRSYGGHLFDDGDRITHMRDADTGEVGKVGTVNEDGTYNVLFSNGVQPMVYQGPEATVIGKLDRSKLTQEQKEQLALEKVAQMRKTRHLDDPLVGGQLPQMDKFNTGKPQWAWDEYANYIAGTTAPTIGDFINAGIMTPMQLSSPSHWAGVARNWDSSKGWDNVWEPNSGFVSKEYADEHPYMTFGINMLGDAALGAALNGTKNAVRIAGNIKDRNKFVFKYLEPASYHNIWERGKNVASHIIHDKNFAKGEVPEKVEDIGLSLEDRAFIKEHGLGPLRDDSYRKYLQLPEKHNLYIDNGDGTWSYNMESVKKILKGQGYSDAQLEAMPFWKDPGKLLGREGLEQYGGYDFITSGGGNVTIKPRSRSRVMVEDEFGKPIGEATQFTDDMIDPWDVNPFATWSEGVSSQRLSDFLSQSISNWADKKYQNLYDRLYKNRFAYNHLGGKQLNTLRVAGLNPFFTKHSGLRNKIDDWGSMEMGWILGGKPFDMRTTINYKRWNGLDGAPEGQPFDISYANGGHLLLGRY